MRNRQMTTLGREKRASNLCIIQLIRPCVPHYEDTPAILDASQGAAFDRRTRVSILVGENFPARILVDLRAKGRKNLPIPPTDKLLYFFFLLHIMKQIEEAYVECFGVGFRIGP